MLVEPKATSLNQDFKNKAEPVGVDPNPIGDDFKDFKKARKSKKNKYLLGLVILLILVIGLVAGMFVVRRIQEMRQKAAPVPGKPCTFEFTVPPLASPSPTPEGDCTLEFEVPAQNTQISCTKTAYQDELSNSAGSYQLITQASTFELGDVIVFAVNMQNNGDHVTQISLTDPLNTGNLNSYFEFLDSNCGDGAYDSSSKILTCPAKSVAINGIEQYIFRVRLSSSTPASTSITNIATITTLDVTATCQDTINTPAPTPTPSPSPSPTPLANCNEPCATNADCADGNHICYQNVCRLDSNPTSTTCSMPSASPVPTPSPTPVIGCNDSCTSNADCSNTSHICYQNRCRLDSNPSNEYCQPAVAAQPVMPETLPQSGPVEDSLMNIVNWLKAALGILGAGALLLLLL